MEAPLTLQVYEFNSKVMQDELHRLGLKVNHHEENIRLLKYEINAIESSWERVQVSPTIRSPATPGSNPFVVRPPHLR